MQLQGVNDSTWESPRRFFDEFSLDETKEIATKLFDKVNRAANWDEEPSPDPLGISTPLPKMTIAGRLVIDAVNYRNETVMKYSGEALIGIVQRIAFAAITSSLFTFNVAEIVYRLIVGSAFLAISAFKLEDADDNAPWLNRAIENLAYAWSGIRTEIVLLPLLQRNVYFSHISFNHMYAEMGLTGDGSFSQGDLAPDRIVGDNLPPTNNYSGGNEQ